MKFEDALNQFKTFLQEEGRSKSTITAYSKDISQLQNDLVKFENIDSIKSVNTKHLENYIDRIRSDKKRNYTLKTVSRKINSMKTFFKFLFNIKVIEKEPAAAVEHPKYEVSAPRILSKMEYSALRDVARSNIRLYTIVEVLLQTGIRIGELVRLTINDLNLETNKKSMNIRSYGSNPARQVELIYPAEVAFRKYLKIRPQAAEGVNSVFITKNGNTLLVRNIRTSITRSLEKIGIKDATVNDIRNTFIVHQLKNGMPIEILGNIVGHKRLTSTKRYLQLIDTKSKRKITKIIPL